MTSPKPVDVVSESWDYLIILDACRYDYFERFWKDYLHPDGTLTCRKSIGSCTDEWRDKSFPDFYEDIVYITANPQFSTSTPVFGYLAGDHFENIHEIWRGHWDEQRGTVLPETVTHEALNAISQYDTKKRFIIHYLQPHAPYLKYPTKMKGYTQGDFNGPRILIGASEKSGASKLRMYLFRLLYTLLRKANLLSNRRDWILRKLFRIPPKIPMEAAWREMGTSGLKKAYEENLKAVLPHVNELIQYLSGTIVVSSDHGEFLGEKFKFGHPARSDHKILREIPWLVIKKGTRKKLDVPQRTTKGEPKTNQKSSPSLSGKQGQEDEEVLQRLRELGYLA